MIEQLTADGTSTTFTTEAVYVTGSLKVYVDGIFYSAGDDFIETVDQGVGVGFEMTTPVPVGSTFVIDYDVGGEISASGS